MYMYMYVCFSRAASDLKTHVISIYVLTHVISIYLIVVHHCWLWVKAPWPCFIALGRADVCGNEVVDEHVMPQNHSILVHLV